MNHNIENKMNWILFYFQIYEFIFLSIKFKLNTKFNYNRVKISSKEHVRKINIFFGILP